MKIERLLAITNFLLCNKRVTTQMLSERFQVSTRTVMRDINTLSLAGIPVVTYYGPDGGYEILDSFKLDKQLVGENQIAYIVTALQGLQTAFSSDELNETLEKMQAIVPNSSADVLLDFSVLKENSNTNDKLILLQRAINLRQRVTFTYINADNVEKVHEVEPVATMYKWYSWYLLCFCPKYEDYRIYKLVRMRTLTVTEQKNSKIHSVADAKRQWEQTAYRQDIMNVKLFCKRSIRSKCEEYLNGIISEEYENGDFLFEMQVPGNEHFWYGTVLAFGEQAKVIEPPDLIERICKSCKKIIEQYEEV